MNLIKEYYGLGTFIIVIIGCIFGYFYMKNQIKKSFNNGEELICNYKNDKIFLNKNDGWENKKGYFVKKNKIIDPSSCDIDFILIK